MPSAKTFLLAAIVCLWPVFSGADVTGIAPQVVNFGDVEAFLTVRGTDLSGTELVVVTIAGPAGSFVREPVATSATEVVFGIPEFVALREGTYSVVVQAKNIGEPSRTMSAVYFSVETIVSPPGPPLLSLPEVILWEAVNASGANVSFAASAIASDGSPLPVTCSRASASVFPLGTTTVTCFSADAFGRTEGTFLVVVTDTARPVLTLPEDFTSADPVVTFSASAVDNVDGPLPVVCSPASGTVFQPGRTTVRCYAEDTHANRADGSFSVLLPEPPPVITVPADIVVEAPSSVGIDVSFDVTATNNATISCVPQSGSTFPVGTTLVTCTATNSAGSDTGTFHVTVTTADDLPPVIVSLQATPDLLWPPNHKMVDVVVSAEVVDAVDPAPTVQIISVTSSQPVNDRGDGDTAPDWVITGPMSLQLRAERSGDVDRTYTILVEATDASGNASWKALTVRVSQTRRRAVR